MKKFIMMIVAGLVTLFTTSSCVTASWASASSQYDDLYTETTAELSYWTIISFGTPYYIDNVLSYYYYRGWYYYPYIWDGYYYFRPYRYIQPRGFVFRPGHGWRPDSRFRWRDNRGNFFRHSQFGSRPFNKGFHNNNAGARPNVRPNGGTNIKPSTGRFGGANKSEAVRPQTRANNRLNRQSSTRQTVKVPQNRSNINQPSRNRGSFSAPSKNSSPSMNRGTFRSNGGRQFGGRR